MITGCACGKDHEVMPTDEDGTPLVCETHKRHKPCRKCLWEESGATTTEEYRTWLREEVAQWLRN